MAGPELLLLRHGPALDRELAARRGLPDGDRPLTPRGERRTRAVCAALRELDLSAQCLCSSPLLRARQTAAIAVEAGLAAALELSEALSPGADPLPLLEHWWAHLPGAGARPAAAPRLVLVGHEPDLSLLAARLIGAPAGSLALRKAGVALLRFESDGDGPAPWPTPRLRLLLSPGSLGVRR